MLSAKVLLIMLGELLSFEIGANDTPDDHLTGPAPALQLLIQLHFRLK